MNATPQPSPPGSGNRPLLVLSLAALALAAAAVAARSPAWAGPSLTAGLALLATFFQTHPKLKVFTFTFWVFTMCSAAMFYPAVFDTWWGFKLSRLNVPLIQIIMFGMGASLSVTDFVRALSMPRAVLLGMFLQFTIMPLTGLGIATAFGFPPEVAAGIVLIGSCSGGVASNVMAYLARGNVALSVTMTACSTLMAPLLTPLLMQRLAGRFVPIDFLAMMVSIIDIVILPIALGLLAHWIVHNGIPIRRRLAVAAVAAAACVAVGLAYPPAMEYAVRLAVAAILIAILEPHWLDRVLPVVSMAAICFIIAIIAADSREELLRIGTLLLLAALLHNLVGYILGYYGARLARLRETDCRTVAFEVGMQNGGMAVGLALDVLKSSSAALAPAVFGTWMNITGSTLASWWRDRVPPGEGSPAEAAPEPQEAQAAI